MKSAVHTIITRQVANEKGVLRSPELVGAAVPPREVGAGVGDDVGAFVQLQPEVGKGRTPDF